MANKDPYTVLRVLPNASHADIRRAYLSRLDIVRPGRFDSKTQPEEWKRATVTVREINEAYEALKEDAAPASVGSPQHLGVRGKTSRTTWVVLVVLAFVTGIAVSSRILRVDSGGSSLPKVPAPNRDVTPSPPGLASLASKVSSQELPLNGFISRYHNPQPTCGRPADDHCGARVPLSGQDRGYRKRGTRPYGVYSFWANHPGQGSAGFIPDEVRHGNGMVRGAVPVRAKY
jgi:hypothetical protein